MLTGQCGCSVLRVAGGRRRSPLAERAAQALRIEQTPSIGRRCGRRRRSVRARVNGHVGQQFVGLEVTSGQQFRRHCYGSSRMVMVVLLPLIGDGRCG